MIEIAVVDSSAEARNRLAERIISFQKEMQRSQPVCPQVSLRPVSLQELAFSSSPDICVVGSDCLTSDLVEIATIRKHIPEAKLIAECNRDHQSFVIIEQMARLGIDDTISPSTTAEEFFRKLILLHKRSKPKRQGKLVVVDSGKGGVGVTSIVAAMAEILVRSGKKVCVVDLDSQTQDLTRFLQVRPAINENLDAILSQERSTVREFVEQAIFSVWNSESFVLVPPATVQLNGLQPRSPQLRSFLSFIEQLDIIFDIVLIDIAGIRGAVHQSLIRVADKVIFVSNPEPASIYSTIQLVQEALRISPHPEDINLIHNCVAPRIMPVIASQNELCRATQLKKENIFPIAVPFVHQAARWPASGTTMISGTKGQIEKVITKALQSFGLVDLKHSSIKANSFDKKIFSHLKEKISILISNSWSSKSRKTIPTIKAPEPKIIKIQPPIVESSSISIPVFEE